MPTHEAFFESVHDISPETPKSAILTLAAWLGLGLGLGARVRARVRIRVRYLDVGRLARLRARARG